jgi:hypothetical protein
MPKGVPAGKLDRTARYAQQDGWFGIFVKDDWKVNAKLTPNLGKPAWQRLGLEGEVSGPIGKKASTRCHWRTCHGEYCIVLTTNEILRGSYKLV